jgi:hypothetical protein
MTPLTMLVIACSAVSYSAVPPCQGDDECLIAAAMAWGVTEIRTEWPDIQRITIAGDRTGRQVERGGERSTLPLGGAALDRVAGSLSLQIGRHDEGLNCPMEGAPIWDCVMGREESVIRVVITSSDADTAEVTVSWLLGVPATGSAYYQGAGLRFKRSQGGWVLDSILHRSIT